MKHFIPGCFTFFTLFILFVFKDAHDVVAVVCYLLQKFAVHESLPNTDGEFPGLPRDRSIRVYSDVDQVLEHLTDPRFEIVSGVDEADIIWTKQYLKDFKLVTIDWNLV